MNSLEVLEHPEKTMGMFIKSLLALWNEHSVGLYNDMHA